MRRMQRVFYADLSVLEDEALFEEKLKEVSEERRAKVLRCKHRADQIRSLGAGLLVNMACQEIGITVEDIDFLPEAMERDMTEKYYCNITHAGRMAAVVISSVATGIDIEPLARFSGEAGRKRMLPIVQRIGTDDEIMTITIAYNMMLSQPELCNQLYAGFDFAAYNAAQFWTSKEAKAKSTGLGLGMDLKKIDTRHEPCYTAMVEGDEKYVITICPEYGVEIEECMMN